MKGLFNKWYVCILGRFRHQNYLARVRKKVGVETGTLRDGRWVTLELLESPGHLIWMQKGIL